MWESHNFTADSLTCCNKTINICTELMRFVSKGRIYYIHYNYCGFSIRWSSYIKKCKRYCIHGIYAPYDDHLDDSPSKLRYVNVDKLGSNITDENEMTSCINGTRLERKDWGLWQGLGCWWCTFHTLDDHGLKLFLFCKWWSFSSSVT